ncbi:hypothetical protein D3C85_556410 [compost metagenome]
MLSLVHEAPENLAHLMWSVKSLPDSMSRTFHSFQSEPEADVAYARYLPFGLIEVPASATVPSVDRVFGSSSRRGSSVSFFTVYSTAWFCKPSLRL